MNTRRSFLQARILIELEKSSAPSVEALATRLGKLRPSVSRSLKLLQEERLVEQRRLIWSLTESGQAEAKAVAEEYDTVISRAQQTLIKIQQPTAKASKSSSSLASPPGIQNLIASFGDIRSIVDATRFASVHSEILARFQDELERQQIFVENFQFPVIEHPHLNISALTEAIEAIVRTQRLNSETIAEFVARSNFSPFDSLMREVNLSVTSIIDDGLEIRSLAVAGIPEILNNPLVRSFQPITEALENLTRAEMEPLRLVDFDRSADFSEWASARPTVATARYARAMRYSVRKEPITAHTSKTLPGPNDELSRRLGEMGREYALKYDGMWSAVQEEGPDYMRHAAISARELLCAVLKYFVPNSDLEEPSTGPLIKPRIKKLLNGSDSAASWVYHFAQGALAHYELLNAHAHGDPEDDGSLRGLISGVDGMPLFLVIRAGRR